MLNQCASCTRCKKKALHEAMRSVGRVGVRAARAQKAACLLVSYRASKATTRKLSKGIKRRLLGQLPRTPEPRRVRLPHLQQVPDLRAHVLDVLQVEGPQRLLVGHR